MSTQPQDKIAAQQKLFNLEQVFLTLNDRFLVPPFSALDARAGYWQQRKRDWLSIGIKSELGRDEGLLGYESFTGVQYGKRGGHHTMHTTSVFDPVLCEVAYRWFAPPGGTVLDPFAGGSVRGIVAAALGRGYLGIDLRAKQLESNYDQLRWVRTKHKLDPEPGWTLGDSRGLAEIVGSARFDAAFSCPPYFDLEQYSDDPRDLSNSGDYLSFQAAHASIIKSTVAVLRDDTFAVWVVGEVRNKKDGSYLGLVPDTISAFRAAGCSFYNEAVLLTMLGTTPIRVSAQFGGGRKLGKVHQNVLVFVKGDARRAAAKVPVEEVALETGGLVWRADGSAEVEETGETADYIEGDEYL